jgi:hypothetical protein
MILSYADNLASRQLDGYQPPAKAGSLSLALHKEHQQGLYQERVIACLE